REIHDNWDQEEEPEVAGTFSQASQDELKTRVIRKAKRRVPPNGGEGQPGVFSAFGGFGAAAASSAKAGSSAAAAAAGASGGGFDFLKTATSPPVSSSVSSPPSNGSAGPTGGSLMGFGGFGATPQDGNKWTCSVCMVPNKAEDDACVCCSTAKSGATPKAPSKGSSSFDTSAISMAPGGGFKFGGLSATTTTTSSSTSSGFKFGSSEVQATSSSQSTPLASGFKFGSPATTSNETLPASTGAGGFKFGSTATNAEPKGSAQGFSFGANNAVDSDGPSPAKKGFNFGSSSSMASSTMNNASSASDSKKTAYSDKYCHQLKCLNQQISEWIKKHVDENPFVLLTPIFADYEKYLEELEPLKSPNEEAHNSPTTTSAASSAPVEKPEARPFQTAPAEKTSETARPLLGAVFGKKPEVSAESETVNKVPAYNPSPNSSFSFAGPSSATSTSMTGPKMMFSFGTTSVVASVASTSSISSIPSASTFSFSGSKSSTGAQGDKKPEPPLATAPSSGGLFSFGSSSSTKTDDSSKSLFTFGSKPAGSTPSFGSTASAGSGFSFGSSTTEPKTTSGFSFGSTPSSTPSSGFSFATAASAAATATTAASNNADANETEESDEPPKVEVKTVEEEGSKYSIRCKLFYKSGSEFKEKGLGMLHLKDVDDGKKTQMVVRAETNLGNILLNILLTDQLNVTQRANNIQFVCVPNPEIKGLEPGPVSMLAKVKTAELAKELAAKVAEAIQ
ncbi:hypothetical protein TCAL_13871, partial [Tigriopus californicus]